MRIVFLGTGGSWPSPERNVSAIAVKRGSEVILFDCGEGTQRQLMKSTVSFMQISKIFISHFHGDHFLGLPGLLQSMSLNGRDKELEVLNPLEYPNYDPTEDLNFLEELWTERLNPYGDKGYNKPTKSVT